MLSSASRTYSGSDIGLSGSRNAAKQRSVGRPELLETRTAGCCYGPTTDEVPNLAGHGPERRRYQADQPPSTTTFAPVT
jgi:hypothetical protein